MKARRYRWRVGRTAPGQTGAAASGGPTRAKRREGGRQRTTRRTVASEGSELTNAAQQPRHRTAGQRAGMSFAALVGVPTTRIRYCLDTNKA